MLLHIIRRTESHHFSSRITAFRPQINQPVTGSNHIQVMLDHHQRMPRIEQLAQGPHQLGNVIKMQAGCGLVKHEEDAPLGRGLTTGRGALGRLSQKTGQLEALGLTARKRGHRLPELDVFQTDIQDRLQSANHIPIRCEEEHRLTNRQVKHISHIERARNTVRFALNGDLQNLRAVAFAVAIRAAQIDVTQKLHLHMLKARSTTCGAAPIAAVGAEFGGGIAALLRLWSAGK